MKKKGVEIKSGSGCPGLSIYNKAPGNFRKLKYWDCKSVPAERKTYYKLTHSDGKEEFIEARCNSWRCTSCAPKVCYDQGERIRKAMEKDGRNFFFCVFTLPGKLRDMEVPLTSIFQGLKASFNKLLKRYARAFGEKLTFAVIIEAHASGYPHLNVLCTSEHLHSLDEQGRKRFLRGWLKPNLLTSGFGVMATLERPIDAAAVSHYIAKTGNAPSHEKISREASKISQLPFHAPKNFRRFRSSRGFLPPPEKKQNPSVTVERISPLRRKEKAA